MFLRIAAAVLLVGALGCRQSPVKAVEPELAASSLVLSFGPVKLGTAPEGSVELRGLTQAPVDLSSVVVEGDPAFTIAAPPTRIPGLEVVPLAVTFAPTEVRAYAGTVVIRSNDTQHPELRIALTGDGATALVRLVPGCDAAAGCTGLAQATPPALDFGEEPLLRRLPLEDVKLPFLDVFSDGAVPLTVTSVSLEGTDAAAFSVASATVFPVEVDAGTSLRVLLRFVPTSQAQRDYAATAVLHTDDPAAMELRVPLTGRARPNLPPELCLNLVEVAPPGGAPPTRWDTEADWAPLRMAPASGYDFTVDRPIPPRAVITFSAHSPGAARACTADPEDGRLLLTYAWTLVSAPSGSPPALAGETGPTLKLAPVATGDYEVRLEVKDAQGNASASTARFRVEVRNDLVAQLDWAAPDGGGAGVDLDLHLVRPGAALFGLSALADGGAVSDDSSGFTFGSALGDAGLTLDWGFPGPSDDPRLNVDDSGDGPLVENISLDAPENDPACASADCTFGVWVHAFRDSRALTGQPSCSLAGCTEGEGCGCPAPLVCVGNAAPKDAGVTGAGTCLPAVDVHVRLYAFGQSLATLPVPALAPPDALSVAAPCLAVHVADVVWPARGTDAGVRVVPVGVDGTGRFTTPEVRRFGWRPPGPQPTLTCAPNVRRTVSSGQLPWYAEEPR